MVGIVLVSHSATIAEGVAQLAREMGGPDVPIEPAGGIDAPEPALGTDAGRVAAAIERADCGDGVLVLMDLGSAVLSAEMALDFLPAERREHVILSAAPLVEGAVAAAVASRLGSSLEAVAAEARGGVEPKAAQLGDDAPLQTPSPQDAPVEEGARTVTIAVGNPLGLHARPAARFVQTVARFDADVTVRNVATGRGPVSGRSLNALATLGARQGHELLVSAGGGQAQEVLEALRALAQEGFGDTEPEHPPELEPRAGAEPGALAGLAVSPGIVTGAARHLRSAEIDLPRGPGGKPADEWAALAHARELVAADLRSTRRSVAVRAGEEAAAIFDAHLLFLEDEALVDPARRGVFDEGRNAADAWDRAAAAVAVQYRSLEDDYLRARAEDVLAVARQVVARIVGVGPAPLTLAGPGILVAPDLTPGETASLDRRQVLGLATARGGPTSHAAILARSLGIPAAVGLGEALLDVAEEMSLLLDGGRGLVYVSPSAEVSARYAAEAEERTAAAQRASAAAHDPASTLDGRRIEVFANLGSVAEVDAAVAAGAEGIGLLRTEFLFMARETPPDEESQLRAYREIAERLEGRPLVIRTLDAGADKPLPFLPRRAEENPFLGLRGIRLALAEPGLLRTQLRAVLRAAADHPVRVMFPMVSTPAEYREAVSLLADARRELQAKGVASAEAVETGVMIEVPAAALAASALAADAAFLSIGTNDLAQYTMAAERGNDAVAGLADAFHPAVLRLIESTAVAAAAAGRPVAVCGELASEPLAVPLLIGLGIDELSVSVPLVSAVKEAVRNVDASAARELAQRALAAESAAEVRALAAAAAAPTTPTAVRR